MRPRDNRFRGSRQAGFTIVELLVYLTISVVVIASIYQMFIGQNRLYSKQQELLDVRNSLRAAAVQLAWEFRQASAAGGDLYSIGSNSFAVRSVQGSGIICAEHQTLLRYGLWRAAGEFYTTSDDSAMVFATAETGSGDDGWKVVGIQSLLTDPTSAEVPTCFWGDTTGVGKGKGTTGGTGNSWSGGGNVPDLVLEVIGNVDDVYIGSVLRAFRRVEYGLYQDEGRWWLGRKVGAAASYEKLTGPLRSPTDSGLVFVYYDQSGNTTADSSQVTMVEIILRGESLKVVPQGSGRAPAAVQDTLTTWVSLRN